MNHNFSNKNNPIRLWKLSAKQDQKNIQELDLPTGISRLNETNQFLPAGVYTTLRTYEKNNAINLAKHFDRLEDSANLTNNELEIDRNQIKESLRKIIAEYKSKGDLRIRIIADLELEPGDIYFVAAPLVTPTPEDYQQGIKVVTRKIERQIPRAKRTDFIFLADKIIKTLPEDAHEAILMDTNKNLLEGLTSNFFAIMEQCIWTADEGVLEGTTRSLVLEVIDKLGYPIELSPANQADLPLFQESFITSASRGVLPVCQIDDRIVGTGAPGEMINEIIAAYRQQVKNEIKPI